MSKLSLIYPPGATPLDPNEIGDLIPHVSTQADLNELEKANIKQAIRWATRSRLIRKDLLCMSTLLRLHKEMFKDVWKWAGKIRNTERNIGVAPHQIAMSLLNLCHDALYWTEHSVYELDEIAIRVHHRLVQIHPFANGNGRHARVTADTFLALRKQRMLSWCGSDLINNDRKREQYISALKQADQNDFQALIAFAKS